MRIKNNILPLVYIFSLLLALWACGTDEQDDVFFTGDEYKNIMQYIDENPEYSSFAKIVRSATMTDVLSSYNHHIGGNNYTLFLPDNDAVEAFLQLNSDYSTLESLLLDSTYSKSVVEYHTVNAETYSYEFPNGVLADRTLSNFFLTVVFRESGDSVVYAINDESAVVEPNISLSNGVVHTLDKMLTPVVYTSYDLLARDPEYSIFTQMLDEVGLVEILNDSIYSDELRRNVYNEFTMFAESNSLYADNGIYSFDDLVDTISPNQSDYTSEDNPLNIYAAYHILAQSYFLDEFFTSVYNTYTKTPVSVDLDIDLKFNVGTEVFDTIYEDGDTIIVDYLLLDLEKSNVVSKSGAIHHLDHMLYPFSPSLKKVEFEFYEEAYINQVKDVAGTYVFDDDDLEYVELAGIETMTYVKQDAALTIRKYNSSNGSYPNADDIDKDYIIFDGNAQMLYTLPKVLPGTYTLQLICRRGVSSYASIQTYIDDVKVGDIEDLAVAPRSAGYYYIDLGTVRFDEYESHVLKIETVIPGSVFLAKIVLQP